MRRDAGLSIDVVRLRFEDGTIEQRFREEAFYDARWLRLLLMLCSLVPLAATSSAFVDVLPILFGPMFWELLQSVVPRCPARAIYSQVTLVLCAVPHVAILLSGTRPGEAQPGLCCRAPDGFLQLLLPVFLHSFSATFMSRMGVHGLALCAKLLTAQRRRDDDSHQVVLLHVAGCLIGHFIEYTQRLGFQRRQQLIQAAEASQRADSRLNHILKNKSVEACYVIAELEDCVLRIKDGLSNIDHGLPSVSSAPAPPRDQANFEAEVARLRGLISSVRSIHTETSQWTHRREMFLQLQHGSYQSRMLPTNLEEALQAVMCNDTVEVQLHVPQPPLIELDAGMLRLQLEEARSNALKYRAPGSCLTVHAELQRAQHPDAALGGTALDRGEMWELHVTMDNRNREDVPLLSVDQCAAVFREGVKGDYDRGNSLGNGVGLDNVTAAARAVGGRAWLSAYVDHASGHAHTVFHTVLPARVAAGGVPTPHGPKMLHRVEEAALFPLALGQAMPNPVSLSPEMLAVSPSLPHARTKAPWAPVAPSPVKQSDEPLFSLLIQRRRVISRGITLDSDTCPSGESNGDTGGDCGSPRELLGESSEGGNPLSDNAGEVLEDTANVDSAAPDAPSASSAPAPQAAAGLPLDGVELQDAMQAACGRPPVCFALDDSPLLQRALLSTFGRLGADPMSRATGTTWAEQEAFVPLVLGHGQHPWGHGGRPSHADIVILDQNLSATDEDRPTGLSRARALASHGFNGMVILHTSYSEQELGDTDLPPYVDLVLDKAGNPRDLACRIGAAYLERAARLRRDPPPAETPPVTPHPPLLSEASRPALLPSPQAALGPSTLRLAALGAVFGLAAARVCLAAPHE